MNKNYILYERTCSGYKRGSPIRQTANYYQFGCGILKMVGPKMQAFCSRIDMLKGNRCILRIGGAPVCQKVPKS